MQYVWSLSHHPVTVPDSLQELRKPMLGDKCFAEEHQGACSPSPYSLLQPRETVLSSLLWKSLTFPGTEARKHRGKGRGGCWKPWHKVARVNPNIAPIKKQLYTSVSRLGNKRVRTCKEWFHVVHRATGKKKCLHRKKLKMQLTLNTLLARIPHYSTKNFL